MVPVASLVMSVDETARVLGCSRRHVFNLLNDGTLERAPRYGRSLRVYSESVRQALTRPEPKGRKSRARRPTGPERINPADIPI